jgi:hypothetical protein
MVSGESVEPTKGTVNIGVPQEASGLLHLPWSTPAGDQQGERGAAVAGSITEGEWLLAQPDLPYLMQVLPAQRIVSLIDELGLEDSAEIVEWVRGEQLIRVMDLELWSAAQNGLGVLDVSVQRFVQWIRVWNEIAPEFAAERFLELEEETIVVLCRQLFDIVPVGLENGQQDDDRFFRSDDGKFHLRVKDADPDTEDLLMGFVRSLFGVDLHLASRVFAYAAMLVEAESREDAERWRRGRLADAGFVSSAEAVVLTRPARQGLSRWTPEALSGAARAEAQVQFSEAGDDLGLTSELRDRVLAVFRTLPEGQRAQQIMGLVSAQTLQAHFGDGEPQPQILLGDDEVVLAAADRAVYLAQHKILALSQSSLSLSSARQDVQLPFDGVMRALYDTDQQAYQHYQGRMARMGNAVASLLPRPASREYQRRALEIVRNLVNLGLEAGQHLSENIGINECVRRWLLQGADGDRGDGSEDEHYGAVFRKYGLETLFQVGLDLLAVVTRLAANTLDERLADRRRGEVTFDCTSGGDLHRHTEQQGTLQALARAGHFSELRSRLSLLEVDLSGEESLVAHAFLSRFAMLPAGLEAAEPRQDLRASFGKQAGASSSFSLVLHPDQRSVSPIGTLADWLKACLAARVYLQPCSVQEAAVVLWAQLGGAVVDGRVVEDTTHGTVDGEMNA